MLSTCPRRRTAAADRRRWWLRQPRQSRRRQGPRHCRRRLPQEVRHHHYRDGQEPLGLPSSAQLPRRHRGGDLLLQARVWRRPLHLARTGPLQGLHLVRRGGAQSGAVRPAQTGLAAPDCKPMKNRQIRPPSTARLPIPAQVVATSARNAPIAHRALVVPPLLTAEKKRLYGRALAVIATQVVHPKEAWETVGWR